MVRSETSSCSANWAAVSRPRAWSRSSSETSRDARILVLLSRACEGSLLSAICHPDLSLDKRRPRLTWALPVKRKTCQARRVSKRQGLAPLRHFRQELYDDLGLRQDSLFELVD